MRIIPAIDVMDGRCCRLEQGCFEKAIFYGDPLVMAKRFEAAGYTCLHLVDLNAAKAGMPVNLDVLESIAESTGLWVDYGGGIRSIAHADLAFSAGANQVNIGTLAWKAPQKVRSIIEKYTPESVILSVDSRQGSPAISAWTDHAPLSVEEFISAWQLHGLKSVACTDIEKDGMLGGPAFLWYDHLVKTFPQLEIIASGGVSVKEDLIDLSAIGVGGVIIGKAFYEDSIGMQSLKKWL